MTFNPIKFADQLKKDMAIDYIGKKPKVFKILIDKFYSTDSKEFDEKLDDFIKFKGPYMQALTIPKWSDISWKKFAENIKLYDEIIEVFCDLGFEKLFSFQEESIKSIIDGVRELLVVASTGRGKTEGWLIPILNYILGVKKGDIAGKAKSVKALLIYPTKALSQDQFKRIIKILSEINHKIPTNQKITIGIYDGDTPRANNRKAEVYLSNAFRYFTCPLLDPESLQCQNCGQHLMNSKKHISEEGKERYYIKLPNPACEDLFNLDFIYLTKNDIIANEVDIILTNPDTINYRLININAEEEKEVFVFQPKFIVLDEIHIYNGIFGAFTSLLLKRYKKMRKVRYADDDDLRIIAASATVQNKEELFAEITSSTNPKIVEEGIVELEIDKSIRFEKIPQNLTSDYLNELNFIKLILDNNIGRIIAKIDENSFNKRHHKEKLEIIQNHIYQALIRNHNEEIKRDVYLNLTKFFYSIISSKAQKIVDIKKELVDNIDTHLNIEEIEKLFYNLYFIGTQAGIIENRIHLFSWPIDGYYGCINCGSVFSEKVNFCPNCNEKFITSICVCATCGEIFYESWFCPECFHLFPSDVNIQGMGSYLLNRVCSGGGTHQKDVECFKIIWKPTFKCNNCGSIFEPEELPRCPNPLCESSILDFIPEKLSYYCNSCKSLYKQDDISSITIKCPDCISSDLTLSNSADDILKSQCSKCGLIVEQKEAIQRCSECNGIITPYLSIPWVCVNCGEKYFTGKNPPSYCSNNDCRSKSFALNGNFEINHYYHCSECKKNYIISKACAKVDHTRQIQEQFRPFRNYKMIYNDFSIRKITSNNKKAFFQNCYHRFKTKLVGKKFDKLYYTPLHTAITSSSFLLKYFIENTEYNHFENIESNKLKEIKLMSFADSINEMEDLAINFLEPEYELFIDQLIYYNLREGDSINLKELQKIIFEDIIKYFIKITGIKEREKIINYLQKKFSKVLKVKRNKVRENIFKDIQERFLNIYHPRNFVNEAIANYEIIDFKLLNTEEIDIIKRILNSYRAPWLDYLSKIKKDSDDIDSNNLKRQNTRKIIDSLIRKGYIIEDYYKFYINPEKVLCYLINEKNQINYDPISGDFYSNYIDKHTKKLITYGKSFEERIDLKSSSNFSRNLYRIVNFKPGYLNSIVYRGSTPAEYRRDIEYKFKHTSEINFLSTGPAMEVGIDIGDLNILLLYGTPPNINSYLQRIGRAGRKGKSSLIFSVSKRNPIDFYYYNNTLDLMSSESQPVPLNTLNSEVIKISLSWAIIDYISLFHKINWYRDDIDNKIKYEGIDIHNNIKLVFTKLLMTRIKDLITSYNTIEAFVPIRELISRDKNEIKTYLKSIVDFSYCSICNTIYYDPSIKLCNREGCKGLILNYTKQLNDEHFFEDIIDYFRENVLNYPLKVLDSLESQIDNLEREKIDIRQKVRRDPGSRDLYTQLSELSFKVQTLSGLKENINNMKFSTFFEKSKMKKYYFGMRNIDDEIEIYRYVKRNEEVNKILDSTRNLTLALSEYHPYAKVRSQMKEYFVINNDKDQLKIENINQDLLKFLKERKYCPICSQIYQTSTNECPNCKNYLEEFINFIPRSADILFEKLPINISSDDESSKIFPNEIYPLTDSRKKIKVRNTYAEREAFIYHFEAEKILFFKNKQSNDILFELKYGSLKIGYFSEKYHISYSNGIYDKTDHFYIICNEEDCNSVLDLKNDFKCPIKKDHSKTKRIRFLRDFNSKGIEIKFHNSIDGKVLAHTLAHGLRLALQKIAGVEVRDIEEAESSSDKSVIYIFDSYLGGNGICETLFYNLDNNFKNLEEAFNLIIKNFKECCNYGCPHCIYQYGCYNYNKPNSFNKMDLLAILNQELKIEYNLES